MGASSSVCGEVNRSCQQNCAIANNKAVLPPPPQQVLSAPPAADAFNVRAQDALNQAVKLSPCGQEYALAPLAPVSTPATGYTGVAPPEVQQSQLQSQSDALAGWTEAPAAVTQAPVMEACAPNNASVSFAAPPMVAADPVQEEPEPAPEELPKPKGGMGMATQASKVSEEEDVAVEYDSARELFRARACALVVILHFLIVYLLFTLGGSDFGVPVCPDDDDPAARDLKMCDVCGSGGYFLPVFGEYEQSLPPGLRGALYFIGLLWVFLGIGVVCDQFMAAIEQVTSSERVVWVEVHKGAKHKFHKKVWNGTVANLTLMALGSSAPEILLNVVEICGSDFFAGELGPSTIVGSAAFNLLVITAVCVSALPAPETRRIAGTDVFIITASTSVLAYLWLVVILQMISPNKVDLWEACLTLGFFPILVVMAFLADKGYFAKLSGSSKSMGPTAELTERIKAKCGKEIPAEALEFLLQQEVDKAEAANPKVSKAKIRQSMRGAGDAPNHKSLSFGFKDKSTSVFENEGTLQLKVVASREPGVSVTMRYCTVEGSAKEGSRYKQTDGILTFGPYQAEKTIEIAIIDNDVWEANEDFQVQLSDLQVVNGVSNSPRNPTKTAGSPASPEPTAYLRNPNITVTILNDDVPGVLGFDTDTVYACEGSTVTLGVNRSRGVAGRITCRYHTVDGKAVAGKDYQKLEGTLVFEHGEAHKTVQVPIKLSSGGHHKIEADESFRLVLDEATDGAAFDKATDGGALSAICDIVIPGAGGRAVSSRLLISCYDGDKCAVNCEAWKEQFVTAFYCNGAPAEQSGASTQDWIFHGLSLFWKVLFAVVPPPGFGGGWVCFWSALAMIGAVTAVVGDMAGLLGCCVGIPDDITAVTLVALGTSLPDTFASKVAAQQNDTADDSVGNVTGSNCVNVFLGLGLPWTIGALYWTLMGRSDEWNEHRYKDEMFSVLFADAYPGGGFMVPAGSLVFSVLVFTVCAIACIMLLYIRRRLYGGELGGPQQAQNRDSIIMVLLWCVYIVCSIVKSLSS